MVCGGQVGVILLTSLGPICLRSEVEIGGRGPSRTLVVMSITSPDGVREMGWHLSVRIPTASHVEEGVEERNLRWPWCRAVKGQTSTMFTCHAQHRQTCTKVRPSHVQLLRPTANSPNSQGDTPSNIGSFRKGGIQEMYPIL